MKARKRWLGILMYTFFSIAVFIFVHIILGKEYVMRYFVTMTLVSIIPMWTIIYYLLEKLYLQFLGGCIETIFKVDKNYTENVCKKIFGINAKNIAVDSIISILIISFYIYFGENGILIFPPNFQNRWRIYLLGVFPIICGSFAGSITVRAISEAWKVLKRQVDENCFENYVFYLQKIKFFLNIDIICTYLLCGSMYIAVWFGPLEFERIFQPIIVFLVFLALWPFIIHAFCRAYLRLVRDRILEEKFRNSGMISVEQLEIDVKRRKAILELSSAKIDQYGNYSFVFSLLICIAQIIVIFWGK